MTGFRSKSLTEPLLSRHASISAWRTHHQYLGVEEEAVYLAIYLSECIYVPIYSNTYIYMYIYIYIYTHIPGEPSLYLSQTLHPASGALAGNTRFPRVWAELRLWRQRSGLFYSNPRSCLDHYAVGHISVCSCQAFRSLQTLNPNKSPNKPQTPRAESKPCPQPKS